MRVRGGLALLLLALIASACNLRRPEVRLTLAPIATNTPAATDLTSAPVATATAKPTLSPTAPATATFAPTVAASATSTDIAAPTESASPTRGASATALATATRILPNADRQSPTPATAQTLPPGMPQRAEDIAPSATAASDLIAPREFEPTLDGTEADQLISPRLRPTEPVTWTPAPTVQLPAAEGDPTTVSTPPDQPSPDAGSRFTPGAGDAAGVAEAGALDRPPTATATPRPQPTVALRPALLPPTIAAVSIATTFSASNASVYHFNVASGQVFRFGDIQLGDGLRLFLPNPTDPAKSWIRADHYGMLRYKPLGAPQEGVMSHSPFFAGFGVNSIHQNKNRIVELDWSADGRQFSFRIDPPAGTDTANAGLWFWQPGSDLATDPTYAIMYDCPADGFNSCDRVRRAGPVWHWKTRAVAWSPIAGDNTLLLTVELPDERRNALALAQAERNPAIAERQPHFVRYDYGHWNLNGRGIIVSGSRPDGAVIIGEVDSSLGGERLILDGSALGLWLRDAVKRPNGQVVALGRPGAPGSGPLALYDQSGRQISGYIGDAPPEDVRWTRDRSLALVSAGGRQYAVQVEGGRAVDATDWLSDPRFGEREFGSSAIPSGVVEGSAYFPGQQLRMLRRLNIRQAPTTDSAVIGDLHPGDYIAILAGPHVERRYEWWRVQTASDAVGWIAARIDGSATVRAQ